MSKIKKEIYPFTEVGAMLFEKYPGHYLNLKSAIATVNTHARELGIGDINGKKSYRNMTAKDAERVLASVATSLSPRDAATPIERAIRAAEAPEPAPKEPEPTPTETVIDTMTAPKSITITTDENGKGKIELTENMTGLVIGPDGGVRPICDEFASHRKQFYTDARYFLKDAQTPEERVAIWDALASLYGLRAIKKERQT